MNAPMMIEQEFGAALASHGLEPPEIVADGKLHRFDGPDEKRGKRSAWYVLHGDGLPAGSFGDWRAGLAETWCAKAERNLTDAERRAHRQRIEQAKAEAAAERVKVAQEAREKCAELWNIAAPVLADHPYIERKGIKPAGAKQLRDALLIPLRDASGVLCSLQFIQSDGAKRFKTGGTVAGCYCAIGGQPGTDTPLLVAEGWATACSLHEATGYPVAAAMNAGNLPAVAQALRAKLPDAPMIVCADDDAETDGNPGLTKAREAAQAVGALLAVPDFGPERPDNATDFNDLHAACGAGAVLACIEAAQIPDAIAEPEQFGGADPDAQNYGGGRFELSPHGVFFVGNDKDGNEKPPMFLCSPLRVIAKTRDAKSGAWGRLLEWQDDDRVTHRWAMPLDLLQGDGADMRRELASMGLTIAPTKAARDMLASYVQVWKVEDRARCVERLGWHGGVYVTAHESIGENGELVVFQNAHAVEPALSQAGAVDDWRQSVGALAAGNTRMVFALSVAFAGALADVAGEDSGGFHLRGGSSSGKTTALKVAASVWGEPSAYVRMWRATANGLEGLAALHNDGLLILDELSQIDPKEAGDAAYLLANGQGKVRASRTGAARQSARWRLLFLSAGEESLSALMARAGKRANAGQEIRLADIEADAGAGMGAFEQLHGHATPAEMALAIKDAATRNYGAVGMEWLHRIVEDRPSLADFLHSGMAQFVADVLPAGAAGQVQRVARRFALVAVAGELASHYGLTGWQQGESERAAKACFAAWLGAFGGAGNREERAMLAQVRAFFEAHGASRFEDMNADHDQRIINRAGFYRNGADGGREYLVLPEAFKRDVCQGFDAKAITAALMDAGWIERGGDGKATQKPRLPGMGPTRCYVFTSHMWEGDA